MKKVFKVLMGLLLSSALVASAAASQAYYGAPKLDANKDSKAYVVRLINYTYDTYTSNATYQPTGRPEVPLILDIYGTYNSMITYPLYYPDNMVCFNIVRNIDRLNIYSGCVPGGYDVQIGPYAANSKAPVVKITPSA